MLPRATAGRLAAAAVLGAALFGSAAAHAQNPNALWQIVHDKCVPDQTQHGDPKPCAEVNLGHGGASGYAILKDIRGATQFLLIPTERVGGIESVSLLSPGSPNYFADAWAARGFVERVLSHPMPRDTISLAINSQFARSQNQLHIHIDCIRADVRAMLLRERAAIGRHWAPLGLALAGHRYRAMLVAGTTLAGHNPFKLLARGIPGAVADMGHYTLVVVGMTFADRKPGFVVLADHADPAHGDNAGGEELQDHACALGHQAR
jgi:CDP-diacylglycerol pyrophosphatase